MSFLSDIKAFQQKALLAANKSVSEAAFGSLGVFQEAVALSPTAPEAQYAKGLLINSWYPSVGGFDTTVGTTTDYYGSGSLSRIKAMLSQNLFYGKDNMVTLTNSVDHAYRVEYLGYPMGEGTNGWEWTGKVGAYKMVATAVSIFKSKYI